MLDTHVDVKDEMHEMVGEAYRPGRVDHSMEDDRYDVVVMGYRVNADDGSGVVEVGILHDGILCARVTEVPNDLDDIHQAVSQIMAQYKHYGEPYCHIECSYWQLDGCLADIWGCIEEDEERVCSEDECLAEFCPFSEESRGLGIGERINALVNCELIPIQVIDTWLDLQRDLEAFQKAGWSTHVIS